MHRSTAKNGLAPSTTARAYVRRNADETGTTAKCSAEMLQGGAAEEAFVSLFESFEDFDAMAREACQAPMTAPDVSSPVDHTVGHVGSARSGARRRKRTSPAR
jgi:hypothetical protein